MPDLRTTRSSRENTGNLIAVCRIVGGRVSERLTETRRIMSDQTDPNSGFRAPPHVPAHLVRDVDFYQIPVGEDPQRDYAERFRDEPDAT
jgi:hypothetical protein